MAAPVGRAVKGGFGRDRGLRDGWGTGTEEGRVDEGQRPMRARLVKSTSSHRHSPLAAERTLHGGRLAEPPTPTPREFAVPSRPGQACGHHSRGGGQVRACPGAGVCACAPAWVSHLLRAQVAGKLGHLSSRGLPGWESGEARETGPPRGSEAAGSLSAKST